MFHAQLAQVLKFSAPEGFRFNIGRIFIHAESSHSSWYLWWNFIYYESER
jgi:hypothetical protein